MKKILITMLSLLWFLFFGCDTSLEEGEYRKEVVVNGTLFAGQNVDTLWVNWTGEVDKFYDQKLLAISNATVVIQGIDVSFSDTLIHDNLNPGRYYSIDINKKITPTKTYKLEVTIPGWPKQVTATTTIPDTFTVSSPSLKEGDTLIYDTHIEDIFYWSPSNHHETYMPTITSLDPDAAMIMKSFYPDTTSKDFERPEKITYRIALPKEQIRTLLSRIFFNYYGRNQLDVYAVDFNYSDFINQAIPAQGGELKEIRYTVQGGIGVFGAKTKANGSFTIYMKPK